MKWPIEPAGVILVARADLASFHRYKADRRLVLVTHTPMLHVGSQLVGQRTAGQWHAFFHVTFLWGSGDDESSRSQVRIFGPRLLAEPRPMRPLQSFLPI